MEFLPLQSHQPKREQHLLIAGPCSAESIDQLEKIVTQLSGEVDYIRFGVWKPRTRPHGFEGLGESALSWIHQLKQKYKFKSLIEVATTGHVELAKKYQVDAVWIGARTTVNPFMIDHLALALKDTNLPIFIKNPVNPDLHLWIGAFERFYAQGINNLVAVHRGFSSYYENKLRNEPIWSIPIELKKILKVPVICDPSHISGSRQHILELSQTAIDFAMDGLMVEVHPNPQTALTDKDQQLGIEQFLQLINGQLKWRIRDSKYCDSDLQLESMRSEIDQIDLSLLEVIARRGAIVEKIARIKNEKQMTALQLGRWEQLLNQRLKWSKGLGISGELTKNIFESLHEDSLRAQHLLFKEQNSSLSDSVN